MGIHFVGAPTDRDTHASRFARRNCEFVTYHTARVESIENRKKSQFSEPNGSIFLDFKFGGAF